MMLWAQLHLDATPDHLGIIPQFLSPGDERPATEQINQHYIGGWYPTGASFTLRPAASVERPESLALLFPGDPPLEPLWATRLRDELIVVYEYGFTAVFQQDGSFECDRLD